LQVKLAEHNRADVTISEDRGETSSSASQHRQIFDADEKIKIFEDAKERIDGVLGQLLGEMIGELSSQQTMFSPFIVGFAVQCTKVKYFVVTDK
jgi:hypothetical protein